MITEIENLEIAVLFCLIRSNNPVELFADLSKEDFFHYPELFTELHKRWKEYGKLGAETIHVLSGDIKKDFERCSNLNFNPNDGKIFLKQLKQFMSMMNTQKIALSILSPETSYDEMLSLSTSMVKTLNFTDDSNSYDMKTGLMNFLNEKQNPKSYISTGFSLLDKHTYLEKGDFVIIGARPSVGKTALAINLAVNIAKSGYKTVFFTLETSAKKIFDRLITSECLLDYDDVKKQVLSLDDWQRIVSVSDRLITVPLEIVEASGRTVDWIRAESIRRKAEVIFIDYVGIVRSNAKTRYEKITDVSMSLHELASAEKLTVFALSQLNRDNVNTAPSLANLRESGQLEQDADVAILLHKDLADESTKIRFEVAKNKEGVRGIIPMHFIGKNQKYVEDEYRYE